MYNVHDIILQDLKRKSSMCIIPLYQPHEKINVKSKG